MSDTDREQTNHERVDRFATEALERYEAFTSWMISQWPQHSDPLTNADFSAGRREMDLLLGAKLHASGEHGQPAANVSATGGENDANQYLPVTPAPWP
ncbi:MAG: hypothetical protein V4695_12120 [Pseudomonadota bacterium]